MKHAWAIRCDFDGKPFLTGIFYYAYRDTSIPACPAYLAGCKTALFKTREVARYYCAQLRSKRNKATVVKVSVEVKEIK
jgi:hypothetical protein